MKRQVSYRASPAFLMGLAFVVLAGPAAAQNPAAPPGTDPGGPAVALISTGIDYTDAVIASRLARDGEGEPIAWDFVDNDLRPFALADPPAHNGTLLAKLILSVNPDVRLINVRVSQIEEDQLAKAAMFLARTPARVTVVGTYPQGAAGWEQFAAVARETASNVLFVVPAGPPPGELSGSPYPVQLNLANAIAAAPLRNPADNPTDNAASGLSADARIEPREVRVGEGSVRAPTNGLEAAAMLGGYATCVLEGTNLVNAVAARAVILEQAGPGEGSAAIRMNHPNCAADKASPGALP